MRQGLIWCHQPFWELGHHFLLMEHLGSTDYLSLGKGSTTKLSPYQEVTLLQLLWSCYYSNVYGVNVTCSSCLWCSYSARPKSRCWQACSWGGCCVSSRECLWAHKQLQWKSQPLGQCLKHGNVCSQKEGSVCAGPCWESLQPLALNNRHSCAL